MEVVLFLNKWLHLLSIIGTLGGIAFAWLILVPTTRSEAEAEREVAKQLWKRFGITLAVFWLVALLTGFANYFSVGPSVTARYHMFAGMKMALALLMFTLSLLIAHPSPGLDFFRRLREPLLAGLLILGVLVVGLSAHLNLSRINGSYLKPPDASSPSTQTGTPPASQGTTP